MKAAPEQCTTCGYKPSAARPAGENSHWECSHVECPNRKPITAAPRDRAPAPKD